MKQTKTKLYVEVVKIELDVCLNSCTPPSNDQYNNIICQEGMRAWVNIFQYYHSNNYVTLYIIFCLFQLPIAYFPFQDIRHFQSSTPSHTAVWLQLNWDHTPVREEVGNFLTTPSPSTKIITSILQTYAFRTRTNDWNKKYLKWNINKITNT